MYRLRCVFIIPVPAAPVSDEEDGAEVTPTNDEVHVEEGEKGGGREPRARKNGHEPWHMGSRAQYARLQNGGSADPDRPLFGERG